MTKVTVNNLLDKEALKIIEKAKPFVFPKIEFYLHTESLDLKIPIISKLHIERNFNENITDNIIVEFMMPEGDFRDIVYNNRDNLEITVIIKISSRKIMKNRYKFIPFIENENLSSSTQNPNKETLNKEKVRVVRGQCISPIILEFKSKYITGNFHNTTLENFYNTILNTKLCNMTLFGKPFKYKLFTYPFDNKIKYKNIPIPTGIKIMKLAEYLQNELYGIYKGGSNIFLTNLTTEYEEDSYRIFTYPLYDYERYHLENNMPVLDIISPTNATLGFNESNCVYENGHYKFVSSQVTTIDKLETEKYNNVTGLLLSLPFEITNKKTIELTNEIYKLPKTCSNKVNNIGKFDSNKFGIKFNPDNLTTEIQIDNNTNYRNYLVTDMDHNIYRHLASVNKYQTKLINIVIPKINPEFIYPGMPVSYMYTKENKVNMSTGIVQNVTYTYYIQKKTSEATIIIAIKK